jgi:hypothetical protein
MNKELPPYAEALALKELGFDEPCFFVYRGGSLYASGSIKRYYEDGDWDFEINSNYGGDIKQWVTAPTFSQAFRFFREKYQLYAEIFVVDDKSFGYLISSFVENGRVDRPIVIGYVFHEEAELGSLRNLIELVKGGDK